MILKVLRLCELHLSSDQYLHDQEGTLHLEGEGMALEEEDMAEGLDHRVEDPDPTNSPTQADPTQSFMEHVKP